MAARGGKKSKESSSKKRSSKERSSGSGGGSTRRHDSNGSLSSLSSSHDHYRKRARGGASSVTSLLMLGIGILLFSACGMAVLVWALFLHGDGKARPLVGARSTGSGGSTVGAPSPGRLPVGSGLAADGGSGAMAQLQGRWAVGIAGGGKGGSRGTTATATALEGASTSDAAPSHAIQTHQSSRPNDKGAVVAALSAEETALIESSCNPPSAYLHQQQQPGLAPSSLSSSPPFSSLLTSGATSTAWMLGTDLKGGDLPGAGLVTDIASALDCCLVCRDGARGGGKGADSIDDKHTALIVAGCVGWTFVEAANHCWLKGAVSKPLTGQRGLTSGFIFGRKPVRRQQLEATARRLGLGDGGGGRRPTRGGEGDDEQLKKMLAAVTPCCLADDEFPVLFQVASSSGGTRTGTSSGNGSSSSSSSSSSSADIGGTRDRERSTGSDEGQRFDDIESGGASAAATAAAAPDRPTEAHREAIPVADRVATIEPLWSDSAASGWVDAFPIGNGRLGALLWGQPWDERMPLSEDTLYTSPPKPKHPRTPPRPKNSALSARDGQQQDRGEADQEGSPRGNKRTPLAGEDMSRYGVFTRVRKNLMAHDLPAAEKV